MTNEHVFIADSDEGCPAAAGWVEFFDHLTLPLAGEELAEAQAIVAEWDDPNSPQGGLGTAGAVSPTSTGSAPWSATAQPGRADGAP